VFSYNFRIFALFKKISYKSPTVEQGQPAIVALTHSLAHTNTLVHSCTRFVSHSLALMLTRSHTHACRVKLKRK